MMDKNTKKILDDFDVARTKFKKTAWQVKYNYNEQRILYLWSDESVLPPSAGTELYIGGKKYEVSKALIRHTPIVPSRDNFGLIVQISVFLTD